MTAAIAQASGSSSPGDKSWSMRTGVLIHHSSARSGRFLILPHPRTSVPTYYLHSDTLSSSSSSSFTGLSELYELSTLKDGKFDRSWMISDLNQVISSGQLEILSRVDARFLVISLIYSALEDGKFRSHEDTFEQIALVLQGRRKEEMVESIPSLKAKLSETGSTDQGEQDGLHLEWSDVVTFGNLALVQKALNEVADVQDLPNGEQAYRLSKAKIFTILDKKHAQLSLKSTFVASPNMLGRMFERRWQSESDPSAYLVAPQQDQQDSDCKEAKELRKSIAAEVIATNLPPKLAEEYFTHLGIAGEN
ncbi:uncharacterized protein MEPE_00669 [Melanopsichium pennsylvanicum]|uniref:Ribonuclease H2 subunit B n=1 Tax=Melanopsichium pennsylvanicum TaxID=63383 RepID=A0AAJ4XGH7_9BASI|nr:uncharacterized protein MEPE_00669 [Melanopsichium pennsylvanicum]